ncbi:hypothetical protein FCV25MIE_27929 [Fagus crenata]
MTSRSPLAALTTASAPSLIAMAAFLPIIPNINTLDDFGAQDPPAISGLTSPTEPITEGVTFKVFLNHYVDRSTIFETSLSNDEVIGFSTAGKKLFRNLADILITFSEKGNYAGDFMGRIRMYEDWNVSYPYPAQVPETTSTTSLSDGLRADVKHFRRMVALIIKKYHTEYRTQLSMTFKLFFSEIFIDKASIYSALQFLHPLFYTSKEKLNFIQLIQDYKFRFSDHYKNFDLNETIYGVYNWINKIQILDESDLNDVFNYDPKYYFTMTSKDGKTGHGHTLPYFVRNLYQHYRKEAIDSNSDEKIKQLFPDLSAIIVDAAIRGCHHRWKYSERNETLVLKPIEVRDRDEKIPARCRREHRYLRALHHFGMPTTNGSLGLYPH